MNSSPKSKYKILAPGGSPAHVKTAVEAGTDAVYVGPRMMSGRSGYAEMGLDDLALSREITAQSGVKLYVAINRSIPIGGRDRWRGILEKIREIGPDALIIGSFCVYELVREMEIDLPLHASTFMGIYNAEGAKFAGELGFSRIIMNTSLYIDELEDITRKVPDVEYEIIAYGGICLNDNHRCNLPHGIRVKTSSNYSEAHSRESTYCQLRMTLTDAEGKKINSGRLMCYPILDLSSQIGLYGRIGITSFKIAGRERSPEFVRGAVEKLREGIKRAEEEADVPWEPYAYTSPITRRRDSRET